MKYYKQTETYSLCREEIYIQSQEDKDGKIIPISAFFVVYMNNNNMEDFYHIHIVPELKEIKNLEEITDTPHTLSAIYANKSIINLFFDEALNKYSTVKPSPFLSGFNILKHLNSIAHSANTTLEECLNIAYNEIKNRKGKIINRKFIKDKQDE